MNKRVDFSNIGGFGLTNEVLDFLQTSYRSAFSAVSTLFGNKVIFSGCVVDEINNTVTDGWISYNGEMIPFVGGFLAAQVQIQVITGSVKFKDTGLPREVLFTKVATCGIAGDFAFSELVKLPTLAAMLSTLVSHTHSYADLTDRPYSKIVYSGTYGVGNPGTDSLYTITIPEQPNNTYMVIGTMVSLSGNHVNDNDISWVVLGTGKTTTQFQLSVREYNAVSQNLRFDYIIIKND